MATSSLLHLRLPCPSWTSNRHPRCTSFGTFPLRTCFARDANVDRKRVANVCEAQANMSQRVPADTTILMGEEMRVQALVEQGLRYVPDRFRTPEDPSDNVATASTESIPVIDMAGFDTEEHRVQIVAELGRACKDWGFFQVVNHGLPLDLLERMQDCARTFFRLPLEERMEYAAKSSPVHFVPEGYGSKLVLDEVAILNWRDYFDHRTLPISRRVVTNWPANPPHYRDTVEEYSLQTAQLARRLLAMVSESLGLHSSRLEEAIGEPYQNMNVNYYPPCPQPDLAIGLGGHSDVGALTILWQDETPGLQVRKDGAWVWVQTCPGALIVNLGDSLEILTNGKYKSIEHRVVVNAERSRMSSGTFYDPAPEAHIEPIPELLDKAHPAVYRSIIFREHTTNIYSNALQGKKHMLALRSLATES